MLPLSMLNWLRPKRKPALQTRTNADWLRDLMGPNREAALADLRRRLVDGLRIVLPRYAPSASYVLAEDFAQEALLKILDRLDTFRGDSRFTTWTQKIAIRIALTEVRRKHWENVSLQTLTKHDERGTSSPLASVSGPDEAFEQEETARHLQALMRDVLTERQRIAIQTVMLHGMPLEEVARRMDTNRNALYKLLHDARVRLKEGIESRGLSLQEFLDD